MKGVSTVAFYWLFFVAISAWVLRQFYFSKSVILARRLRLAAGILEIAVLVLLFFPWLPGVHGASGWGLVLQGGNVGRVIFVGLVFFVIVALFFKNSILVKVSAISHIIATVLFFWLMIQLFPRTVTMTIGDTAPIFVALIMLVNSVVILLLWQQVQNLSIQTEQKHS